MKNQPYVQRYGWEFRAFFFFALITNKQLIQALGVEVTYGFFPPRFLYLAFMYSLPPPPCLGLENGITMTGNIRNVHNLIRKPNVSYIPGQRNSAGSDHYFFCAPRGGRSFGEGRFPLIRPFVCWPCHRRSICCGRPAILSGVGSGCLAAWSALLAANYIPKGSVWEAQVQMGSGRRGSQGRKEGSRVQNMCFVYVC